MVSFSHLDEGTSEEVWRADERIAAAPLLHVDLDELVVVAAHPDDETLGAAGLVARCAARDRKSTRLNSSHSAVSRMPSSA